MKFKSINSQAKVVGTVATVGGAMLMTLIRGPVIKLPWTKGAASLENQSGSINLQHPIKQSLLQLDVSAGIA